MAFDIKAALADGYTPSQIADFLGTKSGFDVSAARNDGYTDDQILGFLSADKTAGPLEALKGATKRLVSSTRTGLATPFGAEEAAMAGLERQQAMTEKPATLSWDELKQLADKEGYYTAAKEAISEVPAAIAAQVPYIGEMAAGARAGAALMPIPTLKPAAAVVGGIAAPALTYLGSNVERQAAEQLAQGKPLDVSAAKAAPAALAQAALDRFGLTIGGLGRLVGKAPLGTEAAERLAKESLLGATAKGAGKLAAAEIPTEVTQQMIERAQAGLPLTTPDALNEYKDVLYQTTLMAPLGSAARLQERSGAKFASAQQDAQIAAEQARMRNMELDRINQERAREQNVVNQAQAAQAAQEALNAERNAALQRGEQGDLGFGTTVEEVAARRGFTQPQQDLFFTPEEAARAAEYRPEVAEVPKSTTLTELPGGTQVLTEDAVKSFGFKPNSLAAKAMRNLDFSNPKSLETFDAILDKHQEKIKADNEAAIENFKGELNDLRRARSVETAGESADLFGASNVPEPTAGVGAVNRPRVAGDRTSDAGPEVREEEKPAPLAEQPTEKNIRNMQVGDTITSGGNVYRKTEMGFEMVQPEAPAAQEVIKEEQVAPVEAKAETKLAPAENPRTAVGDELNKLSARKLITPTEYKGYISMLNESGPEYTDNIASEVLATVGYQSPLKAKPTAVAPKPTPTRRMTPGEAEGLAAAKEFEEDGGYLAEPSMSTPQEFETGVEEVRQMLKQRIATAENDHRALKTMGLLGFDEDSGYQEKLATAQKRIDNAKRNLEEHEKMWARSTEVSNLIGQRDTKAAIDILFNAGVYNAYQRDLALAIDKNNAQEALTLIAKNAKSPIHKMVAKLLLKSRTFPMTTIMETDELGAMGSYYSHIDIVLMDPGNFLQRAEWSHSAKDLDRVFLHELIHSATVNNLSGAFNIMRVSSVLGSARLTSEQKADAKYLAAADNILKIFDYLSTRPDFTEKIGKHLKHYGATNPFEMLSEAFTREEFQEFLKSIKVPADLGITNPKKSLWDTFVSAIKELLGIASAPDSALSYVLTNGAALMSKRSMFNSRVKATASQTRGHDALHEKYGTEGNAMRADLDQLYAQAGGKPLTAPVKPQLFQELRNDPAKYVAERRKESSRFLDSIATNWFSSDAALQKRIRQGIASMGKNWDSVKHMLYQASTSQALHGEAVAHQFLELGGITYDPTTYKFVTSKGPTSWKDIFGTINEAAKAHGTDFNKMAAYAHQYMVARRLKGLQARNEMYQQRVEQLEKQRDRAAADKAREQIKLIHLSDEQIEAGLKLGQEIPEMAKIVDQWNMVRKSVLDFAVDSGLYSKEDADALADVIDYVPFYRVEQLEASAGPREYTRGLLDSAMDKAFKGSTQEVNDVFDNMERWASYIIRKGINNKTAQNLVDVAFETMPDDVQAVAKTARGMRENTVTIWRDGELQKYEFSDPLFVKAFTGIESAAIPALKNWAKVASFLRQNVVLNPLFSIAQLPQDAFGAMFVSGVKHPFSLPLEVMSEFYKTLTGTSAAHEALKTMGAVGVRDYSAEVSRIDAEIAAGLKSPKLADKILAPFRALSMASDNAVRQAIYNQTLKETGDKAKAVERAFEVINFRRAGASREATILRQTVPFFGAYLQAMNVAAQVIAGEGIAPAQKAEARKILASTMTKTFVLGLIYASMVEDDDDYKKLDPTIRDHHLIIPGSGGLMIPIRPDIFTLFAKIIPEHMYNLAYGAEDATKAKKALKEGLANAILGPTPLPQAARPVLEIATNHDFYTGRPIVGKGMEDWEAKYQYSPNTSEFSKMLGSVTNTSPMNWDHLLRAYTGYTGGMALMATSSLMASAAGRPLPDKSPQDMIASIPGMSTFVAKEFGTRDVSDYYELRDMVDEAVKTLNNRKQFGTREEAKEYREENKQLLSAKSQVNRINQNLSKIRKQERLISESDMDPAIKEAKLHELNVRKHKILRNIEQLRERAGL